MDLWKYTQTYLNEDTRKRQAAVMTTMEQPCGYHSVEQANTGLKPRLQAGRGRRRRGRVMLMES